VIIGRKLKENYILYLFNVKFQPRHINERMSLIILIAMEFELNEVRIDMK
jgi:hypothetical protein